MGVVAADAGTPWRSLFDGKSLQGWRASENADTWRVEDGTLVAHGPRSHLFYEGPVGDHDFRNFELVAEVRTEKACNSGIYFHTAFQESGWPGKGYEVQINNSRGGGKVQGVETYREPRMPSATSTAQRRRTGSGSRFEFAWPDAAFVCGSTAIRPSITSSRINRFELPMAKAGCFLSRHDRFAGARSESRVAFRKIAIRPLADDVDPFERPRHRTKVTV